MKKRCVILCLLAVFSCLVLTACGKKDLSGSRYVGVWKEVSLSDKDETDTFEGKCFVRLNADGTAQYTLEDEVTDCTWEETGSGFRLNGKVRMTFEDEGPGVKTMLMDIELHFEKQ